MYTIKLWNESIASRDSAEIASCLLKYVTNNFSVLQDGQERTLIVWSDRCVSQNNNWNVLALYDYMIKCNYFREIYQNSCAQVTVFYPHRDFALIERRKRVSKVTVPSE